MSGMRNPGVWKKSYDLSLDLAASSDAWYQACADLRHTLHLLPHRETLAREGVTEARVPYTMLGELYPYEPAIIITWLTADLAARCRLHPTITAADMLHTCLVTIPALNMKLWRLAHPYSSVGPRQTVLSAHQAEYLLPGLQAAVATSLLQTEYNRHARTMQANLIAESLIILVYALADLKPWLWEMFYAEQGRDADTIAVLKRLEKFFAQQD